MDKCIICGSCDISHHKLTIDEVDNIEMICDDCNGLLNERIALVVVEPITLKKTGENMFLSRGAVNKFAPEIPKGRDIYIVDSSYIKLIVNRIINSDNGK